MVGYDWQNQRWSGDMSGNKSEPYTKPYYYEDPFILDENDRLFIAKDGFEKRQNYEEGRKMHLDNFPLMKYDYPCLKEDRVKWPDCAPMFQSDISVEWRNDELKPKAFADFDYEDARYGCKVNTTGTQPKDCDPSRLTTDQKEYIGYTRFKAKSTGFNWESTCDSSVMTELLKLDRPENGYTEAQTDKWLQDNGYIPVPGAEDDKSGLLFISQGYPMSYYIDYAGLESRIRPGKSRIRLEVGEDRVIPEDLDNQTFWQWACEETGKDANETLARGMLCEMAKREHHRSEVRTSFTLTYAKNIQEFKLEFQVSSDKLVVQRPEEFKGPTRYEAPGYYKYQVQWQAAPFPGREEEPNAYPYPDFRYDYVRKEDGIIYSKPTDVQIREPPFSGNWPNTSKHYGLNMGYYAKRGRSFNFMAGVHDLNRDYVVDDACGKPPTGREEGKSAQEKYRFVDDYPEMYKCAPSPRRLLSRHGGACAPRVAPARATHQHLPLARRSSEYTNVHYG